MLRIIQIGSNPRKRISKKKRVLNRRRSKIIHTEIKAGYPTKQAAAIAYRKVKKIRKRIKRAKKAKIVRVRKNPVRLHQTMIVGYRSVLKRKGKLKGVRYYFTGTGFSRDRKAAEIFAGDKAKIAAHRIVNQLPSVIERIQVEPALG